MPEDIVRKELFNHLTALLNLGPVDFEIIFVDDIPLDKNGKLSIVISQLNPNSLETVLFKKGKQAS
jgi:hypothetical protein